MKWFCMKEGNERMKELEKTRKSKVPLAERIKPAPSKRLLPPSTHGRDFFHSFPSRFRFFTRCSSFVIRHSRFSILTQFSFSISINDSFLSLALALALALSISLCFSLIRPSLWGREARSENFSLCFDIRLCSSSHDWQ